MKIEIITLDEGHRDLGLDRQCDTMKEAREWFRTYRTDAAYHDRRAEIPDYHKRIHTVQLWKNDECIEDKATAWN